MKKLFFMLAVLASILWNCGKDNNELDKPDNPQKPVTPTDSVLVLSISDLVFDATGGWQEFTVYCSGVWTLTGGNEWCRPESTSGVGEIRVKVSTEASTLTSDRNVVLTAKSGSQTKLLTVTQKGVNALTLTKDKFDVPQEGGNLTIEVSSNMDYTVTIPSAFGGWIRQTTPTKAMQTRSYYFTVVANEGVDSREGYIIIGGNGLTDTVRVYQAPQVRLILTENTYRLTAETQEFEVELKTNIDYKVIIPDSVETWISCLPETRALRTDRIRFAISKNQGNTTRTAAVIIKERNGERTDTLHISQMPGHVLLLGSKEIYVKADGETIAVKLTTDVDYDVEIPDSVSSWVSRLRTKALQTEELRFTVARNGSGKARIAPIIVKERAGNLSDTLYIRQIDKNDLVLGNKVFVVPAEGEAILLPLADKGDYELEIPDSVRYWISQLKGAPEVFGFFVSSNGMESRTAVVMVKEQKSGLCDTVHVRQEQWNNLFLAQYREVRARAKGETVTVMLRTNVDYDIVIPDSVSSWISRVNTRALRNEEIHLTVAENLTGRERTAKIIVLDKEQTLSDTIRLIQATKSPDGIYVGDIVFRTENDLVDFWDAGYTHVQGNVEVASDSYYNTLKTLEKLDNQLVEINGTLTLNNYNLADLKGLSGLKKITGDFLVVQGNMATFQGLEALESIGGNFDLSTTSYSSSSQTFEGLERLTSIGGNLKAAYRSLKGLSSLKSIGGNAEFSSISSLEGLERLENIGGNFKVSYASYLTSFKGLSNLRSISGDFELAASSQYDTFKALESFEGLERLESIGGNFKLLGDHYSNSFAMTSFKGLNNLTSIGGDFELLCDHSSFKALESFAGLERLKSIGGSFKLLGDSSDSFIALTSFKGLSNLMNIGGDFELFNSYSSFKALESFTGLERLESIGGSFKVLYTSSLTSFKGLSNLRSINGDFETNTFVGSLESFEGLERLESIGRNFKPYMKSFKGLSSLTSIDGDCELNTNIYLESFEGLERLERISGNLKINLNFSDSFVAFVGLNGLKRISGNFEIHANNSHCLALLSDFNGLGNLQDIGGDFKLIANEYGLEEFSSFKGLDNLKSIGGDFEVNTNSSEKNMYASNSPLEKLASFEGLETLEKIGGSLRVIASAVSNSTSSGSHSSSSLPALTSFRGLSGLKTIGGDLEVKAFSEDLSTSSFASARSASALDALTSFEGLDNLQSIGGSLKVTASTAVKSSAEPRPTLSVLKSLTSFDGLNSLTSIGGESFIATGCPALSDFCALRNALQSMSGTCEISGNAYNPNKIQILNNACSK